MMEPSAAGALASGSHPAVGTAGAGGEPPAKKSKTGESPQVWWRDKNGRFDQTAWWPIEDMTKFANELKSIKPLKVGDTRLKPDGQPLSSDEVKLVEEVGMEIYPMTTSLHMTEEGNTWLFVRKHAKDVWNEVLKRKDKKSAVIGSPGIGKSVSSLYLLKKLLEKNTLAIYEARRDEMVYAFIPPGKDDGNTEYVVYSAVVEDWRPQVCPALAVPENYYLIDPGGKIDIVNVRAHTVSFPSPGPERLGDWGKGADVFYVGCWAEQEVSAVRPFLLVKGRILDGDTVKEAFRQFGGVLRHVYAAGDRQALQTCKALRVLKDERLVRSIYEKGVEALGSARADKPSSALFMLVPVEDIDSSASELFTNRPGTFRPFAEAEIAIVSDWARCALVKQYWDDMYTTVAGRTHQNAAQVGWLFEDAAHLTLPRGGNFHRRYLDEEKDNDMLVLAKREVQVVAGGFGVCLRAITDAKDKGLYVRPVNPKMPLLDAAEGATTELYQMTINTKHDLTASHLKKAVEVLLPKGKRKGKAKGKLVINWVVPEHMFQDFKRKEVDAKLERLVEQRAICCTPVKPE